MGSALPCTERSIGEFGYAGTGNNVHTMKMWGSFSTFSVLIEANISGTKKRGANRLWSGVGKRPVANGRVLEGRKNLPPSWAVILLPVLSPIIQHLHQTLSIFFPNLFSPSTVCTSVKEKSSPPPLRVPCSLLPAAKHWSYAAVRRAARGIRHLLVQCLGNTEPLQYP